LHVSLSDERQPSPGGCAAACWEARSRRSSVYSHRLDAYASTVRKSGLGGTGVHGAVQVFTYINRVAYIALGAVVFLTWYRRPDRLDDRAPEDPAAGRGPLGRIRGLRLRLLHPLDGALDRRGDVSVESRPRAADRGAPTHALPRVRDGPAQRGPAPRHLPDE